MSSFWQPASILVGIFALMMFFQNCSSAVPFGTVDRFASLVESDVFPYEVSVDQVAYMSCSEQENVPQDGTFFTFKVGAYRNGGLRVTEEFRNEVIRLNDESVVNALMQNFASTGSRLQLAIRPIDNLQLIYLTENNGQDGLQGEDFYNIFTTIGDQAFTSMLWYMEPGDYLRYWPGAQFDSDYRLEGTMRFLDSELIEGDLRNFMNNRGVLAVTFSEEGDTIARGPGSQSGDAKSLAKEVYGVALSPRFKQPLAPGGGSPGAAMPSRVLSSVQEIIVDRRRNGTVPGTWSCPDQLQFKIVLPQDALIYNEEAVVTGTRCGMTPDPVQLSADLKAIRQSLPSEDWYVDLTRRCVVPKPERTTAGSCYGKNSNIEQTHIINYDAYQNGCGFGTERGLCPHFVSICVKQ